MYMFISYKRLQIAYNQKLAKRVAITLIESYQLLVIEDVKIITLLLC
jgi:hypothetical protein